MIHVSDLVKKHGDLNVLNGVALDVRAGEVAVVVGPSGGGKSTLLRCINGLEEFQAGKIAVGEWSLLPEGEDRERRAKLLALRRQVGFVFQQFNLFPHLTAGENVMAGPRYVLGQSRTGAEPRARELLERVGLGDKFDARPGQLSGGQLQRVAIARALAVNPSAILFDEPTSALDPKMADEVLGVITDLARAGQTMVVVTHAMGFARRVAHTMHVMHEGRVLESGPPEQLFTEPREEVTRDFLRRVTG